MNYTIAKPSVQLSQYIKHYWSMENCLAVGKEHIQRIVPSGLTELVFYFDDKPVAVNQDQYGKDNSLITGQLSRFYDLKISGKTSLFSTIFQPHGLSALLDIPIPELMNQNVPLKYIFKKDVNEVETKLFEAKSFNERVLIIERYFLKRLRSKVKSNHFERIQYSICKINQLKGFADIDDLAFDACYSRKQFERIFSSLIGTSPKQFLKIIRFQHAIDKKSREKGLNLTELTYQCGYYDQAHMINGFQKLAGLTPGQYFRGCEPYSDYFN